MRKYMEINYDGEFMRGFYDDASSDKCVVVIHGIGGNKLGYQYIFKQMADECVRRGISTFRFDYIGTGESDGKFEETKHSEQISQLNTIIDQIKKIGYKKIYLCSTTIGCYSIWHCNTKDEVIKGIINWNPICDFDRYEKNHRKEANKNNQIIMGGIYLKASYLEDLTKLKREIPTQNVPVLFLQGMLDEEYKFSSAKDIAMARNWKYIAVEKGDHLWANIDVRKKLFNKTIEFILNN